MKLNRHRKLAVAAIAAGLWTAATSAQASDLLFSQLVDGQSAFGPSEIWTPSGINSEIADDFDVTGTIDRITAYGFVSGTVSFQGMNARFYQYNADGTPGALQKEYFLTTGFDPATGTN